MFKKAAVLAVSCGALWVGCGVDPEMENEEIVSNLVEAGFRVDDLLIADGKVYVGRDAHVTLEASREMLQSLDESSEQYRTTNQVGTGVTKICVNPTPDFNTYSMLSQGLDLAIANYNERGLRLTFARGPSTGCTANITAQTTTGTGGSAGFPSGGLPYGIINIGTGLQAYSADVNEHVITHELGHAIGFRHSDYYNRSISCGAGGDEGDAGVGAIHIPGTPTTASVGGSIMNSCFRSAETGEFTGSDVTALLALYPQAAGTRLSFRTATGNFLVAENGGGTFVGADRTAIGDWERFGYVDLNGGELLNNDLINLRAANGQFVVAENGGGGVVNANRAAAQGCETFRFINLEGRSRFQAGDRVALQASNGQYVVAENGGGGNASGAVNANRSAIGAWETFVLFIQ